MRYHARITATSSQAGIWARAIAPEADAEGVEAMVSVTHGPTDLAIEMTAGSSRILRATLNSQLRWLATAVAVSPSDREIGV